MRIAPTSSRGFTIVEALLAFSLLGGLSIATMKLLDVQKDQRLNLTHAADSQAVLSMVTSILGDSDACTTALGGALVGGEVSMKDLSDPTVVQFAAGKSFGKSGRITSLRVEDSSTLGLLSATHSHEMLKLRITGLSDSSGLGAGTFDRTFYFFAAVAPSPNPRAIASCFVDHSLGQACQTFGGTWNPMPAVATDPLCTLTPPTCPALGLVLNTTTQKCELAGPAKAPPCDKDREIMTGYVLDSASGLLKPYCVPVNSVLLPGNCRPVGNTTGFLKGFDPRSGVAVCAP